MDASAVWNVLQGCKRYASLVPRRLHLTDVWKVFLPFVLLVTSLNLIHAADTPPVHVGTLGSNAIKSALTTDLVITTLNEVSAGDAIVIAYATDPANDLTVTVTDDAGNTYRQSAMAINANNLRTYVFAAYNVNTLVAGAKISIRQTIPGSSPVAARAAVAEVFRGLAPAGALEQSSTSLGNGSAPASGTAVTVQPVQLLIGAVGTEGPSSDAAGTWSGSFTEGLRAGTNETKNDADISVSLGWQVVSGAGNYAAAKSGITQRDWAAVIATYKTSDAGISYIGDIGSAQTKASNGVTLTVTTKDAVTTGDDIMLTFSSDPAGIVSSVTDPAGNSYTKVLEVVNNRNVRTTIMAAYNVTTLPAGSVITINHASVRARAVVVSVFRGLSNLQVLDQVHSASGGNRTVSSGATGTTVQAQELLIGAVGLEGPNYDAPSVWQNSFTYGPRMGTNFGSVTGGGDGDITAQMGWRIVGTTGSYTAQLVNLTTTRNWAAGIATFKSIDQYTLTIAVSPAAGGITLPAAGAYSYDDGTVVSLSAAPAQGYLFDHWTGDVANPLSPSTSVTIHGNKTVTAWFTQQPKITVESPNGGEKWIQGSVHTLTWTSNGTSGNVMIELSTNGGTSWTTLAASTPDDGTYDWTISAQPSKNCLIRITDTDNSPTDQSDAVFTIARSSADQRIGLAAGWNLFSLNVTPANADMKTIVQQLINRGTMIKVQDEAGNTVEQNPVDHTWVNNIGNWNSSKGYRIRMGFIDTLVVQGIPLEDPVTINLQTGWNIIGYPLSSSVNATEVLASLMSSGALQKVQDETGYSLERLTPVSEWINNIGTLDPGEGYQVRVSSPFTFTITPVFLKSANPADKPLHDQSTVHFSRVYSGNGLDHMNVFLSFEGTENLLENGDEIGLFDGERCVGSLVVNDMRNDLVSMVASADDPSTETIDGYIAGNSLQIRIWKQTLQQEKITANPEIITGNGLFTRQGTVWVLLHESDVPMNERETLLGEVYPNPFHNRVSIPFSLRNDSPVDISVYTILGEKIATVVHENLPAGDHLIQWDAGTASKNLMPGNYYCKMTVRNKVFVKKMSCISTGR